MGLDCTDKELLSHMVIVAMLPHVINCTVAHITVSQSTVTIDIDRIT